MNRRDLFKFAGVGLLVPNTEARSTKVRKVRDAILRELSKKIDDEHDAFVRVSGCRIPSARMEIYREEAKKYLGMDAKEGDLLCHINGVPLRVYSGERVQVLENTIWIQISGNGRYRPGVLRLNEVLGKEYLKEKS